MLGEEHRNVATNLNNLGVLMRSTGDNQAALCYYKRAMEISKKVLGAQHPETAKSLANLAMLYCDENNFKKANSYLKEALTINRKVLGDEHPDTKKIEVSSQIVGLKEFAKDLEAAIEKS